MTRVITEDGQQFSVFAVITNISISSISRYVLQKG